MNRTCESKNTTPTGRLHRPRVWPLSIVGLPFCAPHSRSRRPAAVHRRKSQALSDASAVYRRHHQPQTTSGPVVRDPTAWLLYPPGHGDLLGDLRNTTHYNNILPFSLCFEICAQTSRATSPTIAPLFRIMASATGRGKIISTGFTESAVNQVVSKRLAHLLLQVLSQILNRAWRLTLSQWYPDIQATPEMEAA